MKSINKNDLAYVIIAGLMASIIAGVFYGVINYVLFLYLNTTVVIIFLLLAIFLANNIRKQYETAHILYGILGGLFVLNSYLISMVTLQVLFFGLDLLPFFFKLFYSLSYLGQLLNPLLHLSGNLSNMIEWIILMISIGVVYQKTSH
ncbi:MAG: hypothetical protein K9L26_03390 [Candidatus Izimaplasma sp.]|nr:hypothetical protein [Candidatus Izimaplasma bacterium]